VLLVSVLTAFPVEISDYTLATYLHLPPLVRLPALVIVFALSFLLVCRQLSVFTEADFELLDNALPHAVMHLLDAVERLLVRARASPKRVMI
jgi:hypothetical protein